MIQRERQTPAPAYGRDAPLDGPTAYAQSRVVMPGVTARMYLMSLTVSFSVGGAYALIGVKSPAPSLAALTGLLGMLAGEHAVTLFFVVTA